MSSASTSAEFITAIPEIGASNPVSPGIWMYQRQKGIAMDRKLWPATGGTIAAIAVTTTLDATGYTMLSALPLMPLAGLFWFLQRFSTQEMGLLWGQVRHYGVALAYPIFVLGVTTLVAVAFGAVDTSDTDWNKTIANIGLMSSTGILMVLITEEGFFRGWLWASLKRGGQSDTQVLAWSTLAFTAWHISAITLDTGFDIPANEVPVYLINATLIGGVFGLIRLMSGSVIAPTLCHAVWNGLDYPLFGYGEKVGALGIQQTHIYGSEVGILGIGLNLVFFACLWRKFTTQAHDISP